MIQNIMYLLLKNKISLNTLLTLHFQQFKRTKEAEEVTLFQISSVEEVGMEVGVAMEVEVVMVVEVGDDNLDNFEAF